MNDARLRRLEDKVDEMAEKLTRVVTLMEASTTEKIAIREELRDHEKRLADLEGSRNRFIGWLVGSGIGGAGLTAAVMKLLGGGH